MNLNLEFRHKTQKASSHQRLLGSFIALAIPGLIHLEDCPGQPLLPVWHIVAGSTGLLVPLLYLLFDDLNPALAVRCPGLSEALDNIVVFVLPGEAQCVNQQM